jgi:hypothetical protein
MYSKREDTKQGSMRVVVDHFDSLGDYVRHAESNPTKGSSDAKRDGAWAGTDSLAEACELAIHGWDEKRPDVDKLFAQLETDIASAMDEPFMTYYAHSGDSVDMGRYMSGDPECMVDYVTEPQARMGRVVRVIINGAMSCSISADDIVRRGVAVVALLDVIHKLGVGVELAVEMPVTSDNTKYSTVVKLHDSSEMLDINNMMYAVCHPSMLRRLAFGAIEQMPAEMFPSYRHGYGTPSEMIRKAGYDVAVEKLQDGHGDLVRDPVAWVLSTVKGLDLVA